MATSIAGGASTSRKCNPKMPGASSFPRPATTVSQARWRDGNNFRGGATKRNLSREDVWTAVDTITSRPPSSRDLSVGAGGGSAEAARTSTEGAAPTTPPGGVIDRKRQGSMVGSVGPLRGPGQQRSHASAGQPDRPEGEDQLGPTTSHLGPCRRRTLRRTRRTNQMCSTNLLRFRRRHRRLPGTRRRRHSDRRAATLRGSGPVSGPVAGRA
jgi:hypothetical protein